MTRFGAFALAICIAPATGAAVGAQQKPCMADTATALAVLDSAPARPVDWLARASQGLTETAPAQANAEEEPPAADAPLDTVAAYWLEWAQSHEPAFVATASGLALADPRVGIAPTALSDAVQARLLEACVAKPERLRRLLALLPDTADCDATLVALVDRERAAGRMGTEEADDLHARLRRRGHVLREKLVAAARGAHDRESWIEGDEDLTALAALDPDSARPILAELSTAEAVGPRTRALAVALQYRDATRGKDEATVGGPRARLQSIVAEGGAPGHARDLALDALMSSEWEGRDAYFLGLFADPTLMGISDDYTLYRPLAGIVGLDPDYWIPRVAALVGHRDKAVHDNAVTCLIQFHLDDARADALRPLLPWLADPGWSAADDRLRLIQSLDRVELPESVPDLLKVADGETGWELSGAADALAHYKAASAIAPLRRAIERERGGMHRRDVVNALIALGAISDGEGAEAIEAWLRHEASPEAQARRDDPMASLDESAPPPKPAVSIGEVLASRPGDPAVAARLLERARAIEHTEPDLACAIRETAARWPLKVVDQDLLARLEAGSLDAYSMSWLVTRRSTLDAGAREALRRLTAGGGVGAGVAAAILGDQHSAAVLNGNDPGAQRALLIAARHARIPLPLAPIERLLPPAHGVLGQLAERYLEVIDSPEARTMLLARATPRVLGARPGGDPGHNTFPAFDRWEKRLLAELAHGAAGDEAFALLCASYWGCENQVILTMRPAGGELRWHDAPFRYRARQLGGDEVQRVRSFVTENHVDDLPMFDQGAHDGVQYEYVHVRANGGVRVFMNNPASEPRADDLHGQLVALIHGIARAGPTSAHYAISERVPGVEVLYADWRQPVEAVRVEGESVWVQVESGEASIPGTWHRLEAGSLGTARAPDPPPALPPGFDVDLYSALPRAWTKSAAGTLVKGSWQTKTGAWLVSDTGQPRLLLDGEIGSAALSTDGAWLLAERDGRLTLVEVSTGIAGDVGTDDKQEPSVAAWVAPMGRFLLSMTDVADNERAMEAAVTGKPVTHAVPQPMLLDPASGAVTRVSGNAAAVLALRGQSPQAAIGESLAWVAIPGSGPETTTIGRLDLKTLDFTPVYALPELPTRTENIGVDERGGFLYVAIGDLLRIPLSRIERP